MFEPADLARVFALPPGVDFPKALVAGIVDRLSGQPPHAMARVQLIVNTRRMARRIRQLFDSGPAGFLPAISLVTDIGEKWLGAENPVPVSALRRKLELAQMVDGLLRQQPDLAARSSLFDLADSLGELLDEMQGEGIDPGILRDLDVSDMSGHWARTLKFLGIAESFVQSEGGLDQQARQRLAVEDLISLWQESPPDHPVLVAGSTGSRGTTLMLMKAVAKLPQGAVILPGFDFDQPLPVWAELSDAMQSEDHPQFRFARLMSELEIGPSQVQHWTGATAASPARNRLISLVLRPAPVTDAWLREGPELSDLKSATSGMTLVEAGSPREEAIAIALRLRKSAETGQSAALITPDRMLTRQVSAALERWGIVPDDSAGIPLGLSPPGRFLRQIADLFTRKLSSEMLLALLKHPLCNSGDLRGDHLRLTRDLELSLRGSGPPFPDQQSMDGFARHSNAKTAARWAAWVTETFCDRADPGKHELGHWVSLILTLSQSAASGGQKDGFGTLWDKNAGRKAREVLADLESNSDFGGLVTAHEFGDLLGNLLAAESVRERDEPDENIMIWGTLEARVQGADLLILGGLNEGTWPEPVQPDAWLNRSLRHQAGLLLPERRIGLAAHDFQQAVAAPEVWITRSTRSDEADTVAARWMNRLINLLGGLAEQDGPAALKDMIARGDVWTGRARLLDDAPRQAPAARPSPRPPPSARPRTLTITEIKRLIRDPYAIYAKHVLGLKPLKPLVQSPDALTRGIAVHEILESFIKQTLNEPEKLTRSAFLQQVRRTLDAQIPWPTARRFWLARMDKVCDAFIEHEIKRRKTALPIGFEVRARHSFDRPAFTLVGRADRIDRNQDGALQIYDYKSGQPPTSKEQAKFDKQLLLEAAIAEAGGFEGIEAAPVSQAVFIGLGSGFKEVAAPLDKEPPQKIWGDLRKLISAYLEPSQGFTSRRMLQKDTDFGDFDQLARFGEWDRSSVPEPEDVG